MRDDDESESGIDPKSDAADEATAADHVGEPKNDDGDDFIIDIPEAGAADDGDSKMTLNEMQEAFKDPSHPRHDEAVQRNRELAKKMGPALESMRKTVAAQLKSSVDLNGIATSLQKSYEATLPKPDMKSKLSNSAIEAHAAQIGPPIDNQKIMGDIADAVREKTERADRQDQVAAASLETMRAMEANVRQLNQHMENVDQNLLKGNKSSKTEFRWMVTIGTATLLATIGGLIATLILNWR